MYNVVVFSHVHCALHCIHWYITLHSVCTYNDSVHERYGSRLVIYIGHFMLGIGDRGGVVGSSRLAIERLMNVPMAI